MKVVSVYSIENKYLKILTFWVTLCEGVQLIEDFF